MGKGIKMRSAQDALGNSLSIESLQIMHDSQQAIPELKCDHPICGCAVRFVPRYQQNRSNRIEPVDVPAYIGLTRESEHVAGCRYDATGQIKAIIAQSDQDFIGALGSGKRELRLLTLHNGLTGLSLSGHKPPPSGTSSAGIPTGNVTTQFIQSEEKLSSYLRTTADLVRLRALCESDAVLAAELSLCLGSKIIPWNRFFFEQENYDSAWQVINSSGAGFYPIAIAGVVKSHYSPKPGAKYKSNFLNVKSLYHRTDDPEKLEVFEVSIAHEDVKWLTSFPVGAEIVMFGMFKAMAVTVNEKDTPGRSGRTIKFFNHKLIIQPKFKRQVVLVN